MSDRCCPCVVKYGGHYRAGGGCVNGVGSTPYGGVLREKIRANLFDAIQNVATVGGNASII